MNHWPLYDQCIKHLSDHDWTDYKLFTGESDLWIPSMIIALLKDCDNALIQDKRNDTFNLLITKLKTIRPIGYNLLTPCDCDSTIWLAKAIDSMGLAVPNILLEYIFAHDLGTSGFATYNLKDEVHGFIRKPVSEIQGWLGGHDCVSINAYSLFNNIGIKKDLSLNHGISLDTNEPMFQPYWWADSRVSLLLNEKEIQVLIWPKIKKEYQDNYCPFNYSEWPDYSYCSKLLTNLLDYRCDIDALDERLLATNDLKSLMCIMQMPLPMLMKSSLQGSWDYDGLIEGSMVRDINSIVSAALIVSNLSI